MELVQIFCELHDNEVLVADLRVFQFDFFLLEVVGWLVLLILLLW